MNTDEAKQSSAVVTSLDANDANDITPSQFEELKRLILTSSIQINERISALELKLTNEFEELKKKITYLPTLSRQIKRCTKTMSTL